MVHKQQGWEEEMHPYLLSRLAFTLVVSGAVALASLGSSAGKTLEQEPAAMPPPDGLFYPRTYAGEGEVGFRVHSDFVPRDYLYYVVVGPVVDTTIRFKQGFPYAREYAGDGVTQLEVHGPGDYGVEYSGAGMIAVSTIPTSWQIWGSSPETLAAYSGPLPPGWFSFLLQSPGRGSHTHLNVTSTFASPAEVAVFALDDGLQFRGWAGAASSSWVIAPLTSFENFVLIFIHNPTDTIIEGSVSVLPHTPPFALDYRVILPMLVAIAAMSAAVFLVLQWGLRRGWQGIRR